MATATGAPLAHRRRAGVGKVAALVGTALVLLVACRPAGPTTAGPVAGTSAPESQRPPASAQLVVPPVSGSGAPQAISSPTSAAPTGAAPTSAAPTSAAPSPMGEMSPAPGRAGKAGMGSISVSALIDRSTGAPDAQYTVTAQRALIRTSSGRRIDAWTFNGTAPGPTLRVRAGQLLQVTLVNRDIAEGVTIHWHGVDVPNAMDGVAGVTQNAVRPGQRFVYRFRPMQPGTYWYHSHQDSATEVGRGLFGALIVLPAAVPTGSTQDLTVVAHTWSTPGQMDETTIGMQASISRTAVAVGTGVRLRLINTDNLRQHWTVVGTSVRVASIDGNDVHGPGLLREPLLDLGAGGRDDLTLTMPDHPVLLTYLDGNRPGMLLVPPGGGSVPAVPPTGPRFDPLAYGTADVSAVQRAELPPRHLDATFDEVLQTHRGFRRGLPVQWWTINGQRFPQVPMIMVTAGQWVALHIVNRSDTIHPMHLHGHQVLVLRWNGRAATGSPWWTDTVDLDPGDDVVVVFHADNPGIWMDHCHNLQHAAAGMMLHVQYRGVSTPYSMDPTSGNLPE